MGAVGLGKIWPGRAGCKVARDHVKPGFPVCCPPWSGPESHPEGRERLRSEQLFGFEPALGEPMLVMVAQGSFEHATVRLEAVRPPHLTELPARFLNMPRLPRVNVPQPHRGV